MAKNTALSARCASSIFEKHFCCSMTNNGNLLDARGLYLPPSPFTNFPKKHDPLPVPFNNLNRAGTVPTINLLLRGTARREGRLARRSLGEDGSGAQTGVQSWFSQFLTCTLRSGSLLHKQHATIKKTRRIISTLKSSKLIKPRLRRC